MEFNYEVREMKERFFTKTGHTNIEISTGTDQPIVDCEESMIEHTKELGQYTELCRNEDDSPAVSEESTVHVTYERDADWNYVHFSYMGGTGYTIRTPRRITNTGEAV